MYMIGIFVRYGMGWDEMGWVDRTRYGMYDYFCYVFWALADAHAQVLCSFPCSYLIDGAREKVWNHVATVKVINPYFVTTQNAFCSNAKKAHQ